MTNGILYAKSCPINEHISVKVPTVGEIIDREDEYYSQISCVLAVPSDFMVQLDDVGLDFSTVSSFDLFVMLFGGLQSQKTDLLFGDLDLNDFKRSFNPNNGELVLANAKTGAIIDRLIHDRIKRIIRKINHLENSEKKPGNEDAKKYMIERARVKQQRAAKRPRKSQLEDLIVAMVNTEQYKYGYEGTRDLTIYQFNRSVRQVIRKITYDQTMAGCYAGTVDSKQLSQDQLNWLGTK